MTDLIRELVTRVGVQESQAEGGAGLLLKLAKDKLGGDFSKVTAALPEAETLIGAAPAGGGAAGLAGGLLGALGGDKGKGLAGMAGLADGFSKLNLDRGKAAQFVPVILDFLKSKGGPDLGALLAKVLPQ
ncbi:MAG: DUF2780 domain-containing protein [Lentisphaerae bacterium]|nr:DUF2780 domain-containing protein [Lentisphaerota bacterium]